MNPLILEHTTDAITIMLLEQQEDYDLLEYDDMAISSMDYDFSSY